MTDTELLDALDMLGTGRDLNLIIWPARRQNEVRVRVHRVGDVRYIGQGSTVREAIEHAYTTVRGVSA